MERPFVAGNLGPGAQDARLRRGVLTFGLATVGAAIGLEASAPRALLALLFVPFFFGSYDLWNGLYAVCPRLAWANARQVGCRVQDITLPAEQRRARRLATRSFLQGIVMALLATTLVISAHR